MTEDTQLLSERREERMPPGLGREGFQLSFAEGAGLSLGGWGGCGAERKRRGLHAIGLARYGGGMEAQDGGGGRRLSVGDWKGG